ncbi:MAG: hypothetical protein ACK4TP_13520 [Hyphomicrobium sp.]|jgi:hypothetical protein
MKSDERGAPPNVALQGVIALIEDGIVSGRIIFGGSRGIVFALSHDGLMRQVADIIVGEARP